MIIDRVLQSRSEGGLAPDDLAALEAAISDQKVYAPRATIVRAGQTVNFSTFLFEGIMSRYVDDRKGQRQLVAIQTPGDFVDLHAYPLKHLDHDVGTITGARVGIIPHANLHRIQRERPELARKLWFLTLLDAAMHRTWVFRLGRLKAIARVAHFFCETNAKLFAVGHSDGERFNLPLTQFDLAEICGLTSVHVNRVLRELRERGLCTFRAGAVEIHNRMALAKLAEFDLEYLYLADEVQRRLGFPVTPVDPVPEGPPPDARA